MNSCETIKENKENGILSFSDFTIKTKMVNDKEKKEPKFRTPWKTITFDNCLENVNSNVAVICGKVSGITIIDFDDEESYDQMRKDFPMLDEFKLVETNNGFHIYGKYNPDLKTGTNMFEKYAMVDISNDDNIVFAPPTKNTLLDGTVVEYEDKHGAILEFPTELV